MGTFSIRSFFKVKHSPQYLLQCCCNYVLMRKIILSCYLWVTPLFLVTVTNSNAVIFSYLDKYGIC